MADTDEFSNNEVEDLGDLEYRITKLERIVGNFSITGPGISGSIEDGFSFNPEFGTSDPLVGGDTGSE